MDAAQRNRAIRLLELRKFNVDQPRGPDGRWSLVGAARAAAGSMRDEATLHKAFDFHDQRTGLTARVQSIHDQGPHFSAYVSIEIRDREGNIVGGAERTIRPDAQHVVQHDGLVLEPPFQGQGFATRFNAHSEQFYRQNGIERITMHANIDVGGYSWARAGYDFADRAAQLDVANRAARMSGRWGPAVQEQIRKVATSTDSTPLDFAMIGWEPGASSWPGKQIMLGSSWDAVKEL